MATTTAPQPAHAPTESGCACGRPNSTSACRRAAREAREAAGIFPEARRTIGLRAGYEAESPGLMTVTHVRA